MKVREEMLNTENSYESQQINSFQKNNYVPGDNSGKWSVQQHMKYIAFLEYNKQKMKSKQKRRSNKFYQQMSSFISTRNGLQCRSHHQKLEEKYSHISKIILLYKNTFDQELYNQVFQSIKKFYTEDHHFYKYQSGSHHQRRSTQIQTDIGGMSLEFIIVNPNLIMIRQRNPVKGMNQINQMNYNPTYMQPSFTQSNPYSSLQYPMSTINSSGMFQSPTFFLPPFNQN